MANNFTSTLTANIGTTNTTIYTAPANSQVTIIGLSLSNKTTSPVTVTNVITRAGTSYSLVTGAIIPVGGSLVIAGIDEKIVLASGDLLQASCATSSTAVDAVVSALEIT